MSRGKYLSLEEARKLGKLDQFIAEHPSKSEGTRFPTTLEGHCYRLATRSPNIAEGRCRRLYRYSNSFA